MKKSFWSIFLVFVFMTVSLSCAFISAAIPSTSTPTIKGKLHNNDVPIAKALITLYNPNVDKNDPAFKVAETETDTEGQYSLENVEPGVYTLGIIIGERIFDDLPCKSPGAFALDENTWASYLVFRLDDGSGMLTLEIEKVEVVKGKTTVRDINIKNCR
jgi:hypothetical protein